MLYCISHTRWLNRNNNDCYDLLYILPYNGLLLTIYYRQMQGIINWGIHNSVWKDSEQLQARSWSYTLLWQQALLGMCIALQPACVLWGMVARICTARLTSLSCGIRVVSCTEFFQTCAHGTNLIASLRFNILSPFSYHCCIMFITICDGSSCTITWCSHF